MVLLAITSNRCYYLVVVIVVADDGTIGSTSDTDAIAIYCKLVLWLLVLLPKLLMQPEDAAVTTAGGLGALSWLKHIWVGDDIVHGFRSCCYKFR